MEKKETENFVDVILGSGADLDDDFASSILKLHSIDEDDLTRDFKARLRERLSELPEDSKEAHNLKRTLGSVIRYEKEASPDFAKPKDYIGNIMQEIRTAFPKPVFSFHNRSDGEMPKEDKDILDGLANELDDDCE